MTKRTAITRRRAIAIIAGGVGSLAKCLIHYQKDAWCGLDFDMIGSTLVQTKQTASH